MLEFKKLEEYQKQNWRVAEGQAELNRKAASALEDLQALKAEYEALIRRSVSEGVDLTKQIDEKDEQIAKAQKAYERRKKEADTYSSMSHQVDITNDDVMNEWNGEFIPKYRAEIHDKILENLLKAKADYVKATKAYADSVKDIEELRGDVVSALGDRYYYKLNGVKLNFTHEYQKYFLNRTMVSDIMDGRFTSDELVSILKGEVNA